MDKTLLREHYMKMKNFISFLLYGKCILVLSTKKRIDV